jgi:cell cycle checkpoint protein
MAFLKKDLFTSFQTLDEEIPPFSVSLPSIVEALQILGVSDSTKTPWDRDNYGAFSAQALGVAGICRIRYDSIGDPFILILEEPGLSTKCELITYEPPSTSSIPFDRNNLELKVIMDAAFLNDAITEFALMNPTKIIIGATQRAFVLSAPTDSGSAVIQFHRQDNDTEVPENGVLETFNVTENCRQSYKFAHIASTRRALSSASKVSIRIDSQGVLSLQFMIENENQVKSFVDYRLVPLVPGDEDGEAE